MRSFIIFVISAFVSGVSASEVITCANFKSTLTAGSPAQKFKAFLDLQWKYQMITSPESATNRGYPGQNGRWSDASLAAIAASKKIGLCQLEVVKKIPRLGLPATERLNYDLLVRDMTVGLEGHKFPGEYFVIDQLGGIQNHLADTLDEMPKETERQYQDILSRLEKAPALISQQQILMQEGLRRKLTAIKIFLKKVPEQLDVLMPVKVEDSALYAPFKEMPAGMSAKTKAALRDRARSTIETQIYPALKRLRHFLVEEYIPGAREDIAWTHLPNGRAWYEYKIKHQTTTNMTADELHALGLSEVARLKIEMEKIISRVKFKGDIKAFNKHLLTDSAFYYKSGNDLLAGYRDIAKRIDAQLPRFFKKLPRLPYGVEEMPAYKAAASPTAYYMEGSLEAGRAGRFSANTYNLKARPKWGMEALTLHEAVPGHHLQISLAQELENLPNFRKYSGHTAFVEGWALYAESLGDSLGLYKDPYSKYGQLAYEMWRAIRLVVDTGMHSKEWTREQSLKYFMDLLPKTQLEAEVEIDRYITWPGQALGYKVGQLKFQSLRAQAEKELGDNFDLRAFHEEVLRHGSLPMDVLEKQVHDWLRRVNVKHL